MKKLFLALSLCVFTSALVRAAQVPADDYVFQKQIIINKKDTCQAFRIHKNWFATAAHCVEACLDDSCQVKILLAQGSINASAIVGKTAVFIPKKYRGRSLNGKIRTHKNWDVALIRYRPEEYLYEYPEGGFATSQEFQQALQQSNELEVQWEGAINPDIPVLLTYGGPGLMTFDVTENTLVVPRWTDGQMETFSDPKMVLYFGTNQSLWGSDGFGVDSGNSGGAVMLESGEVIGIATAKLDSPLPRDVREMFPTFGRANKYFIFNGFAPKTTLKFIKDTMRQYGDQLATTKKLEKVTLSTDAPLP